MIRAHTSPSRKSETRYLAIALAVVAIFGMGGACPPIGRTSDLNEPARPNAAAVERVVISPRSVLLTEPGQSAQLLAQVMTADGTELSAPSIEWRSSNDSMVTVDANGLITTVADLGSAQITAVSGGVASVPVMVLIAQPAAGAALVADEQVLGDPAPVDPNAEYGLGYRYAVTLSGVPAPQIGQILLGTGAKPVGGRVVRVVEDADQLIVTLALVGLDEMFQALKLTESFELSRAEVQVAPAIADTYDVLSDADGTIQFTPRSDNAKLSRSALKKKIGPFECEITSGFPLTLTIPPLFSVKLNTTIDFQYDLAGGGLQRLVVKGEPEISLAFSPSFTATASASCECKAELLALRVPIGGPLSLIISPIIGVDAGFNLSGELTAAKVGFEASMVGKAKLELGVDCTAGCQMVNSLTDNSTPPTIKPVMPNVSDLSDNFKLDASLQPFVSAELYVGNPFLNFLRFETFQIKLGPKLKLELASPQAQADDADSASSFGISLEAEAGIGNSVTRFMELVKISFVELKRTISLPLSSSPAGNFEITPSIVQPGDDSSLGEMATFTTSFDKSTFLTFDAIDSVEYFVLKNGQLEPGRPLCSSLPASPGQVLFSCQTDFTQADVGEQKYFAFYKARMFGVPLPFPLEVKKNSEATVTVTTDISVSVSPNSVTLQPGQQQQFSATVTGSANTDVAWSATGGTISQTGLFVAGNIAGNFQITARSAADNNKISSAAVTVLAGQLVVTIEENSTSFIQGADGCAVIDPSEPVLGTTIGAECTTQLGGLARYSVTLGAAPTTSNGSLSFNVDVFAAGGDGPNLNLNVISNTHIIIDNNTDDPIPIRLKVFPVDIAFNGEGPSSESSATLTLSLTAVASLHSFCNPNGCGGVGAEVDIDGILPAGTRRVLVISCAVQCGQSNVLGGDTGMVHVEGFLSFGP